MLLFKENEPYVSLGAVEIKLFLFFYIAGSTNNPPLVGTVMIVLAIAISLGFLFFFIW